MKKVRLFATLVVALMLLPATMALAANSLKVKPGVYDPDNTGIVQAAWLPGVGLPDGDSSHGLYLAKNGPTAANAAAGATVDGAAGSEFLQAGFDYNGYCGAGAPRFNVYTEDDVLHYLGCTYGTHAPVDGNPDWTRVRFTAADALPPIAPGSTITYMEIVLDEGPAEVYLDNIYLNGITVGKPGNTR